MKLGDLASVVRRDIQEGWRVTATMAHGGDDGWLSDHGSMRTWTIAFAAILIIACNLLNGINVWESRSRTLDKAAAEVERLSLLGKEHAARSFGDIDHHLSGLAETLSNRVAQDGGLTRGDPKLTQLLLRRLAELADVRALTVIDAQGVQTIDSRIDAPEGIDVQDRDYFTAQRAVSGASSLYLDRPAVSRIDGLPFIGASRRIAGSQGSFAGVVVAVVDPAPLAAFYASLAGGGAGAVVLARSDGTVYVDGAGAGRAVANVSAAKCGDPFGIDGMAFMAGANIVSCQPVPGFPLIAIASVPVATVLAPWQRDALQHVFSAPC